MYLGEQNQVVVFSQAAKTEHFVSSRGDMQRRLASSKWRGDESGSSGGRIRTSCSSCSKGSFAKTSLSRSETSWSTAFAELGKEPPSCKPELTAWPHDDSCLSQGL